MNFSNGFKKTANTVERISKFLAGTIEAGKSYAKGLHSTGSHTIGDTLKLKGLKHISDAATRNKGVLTALKSKEGRDDLFSAMGKATPSIATAGLYGGAAYKGFKKLTDQQQDPYYGYY